MSNITLYSKPGCVQCTASERALKGVGAEFEPIDLTQDDQALAYVKSLGYLEAPVIVVTDDTGEPISHWSGFQPDKIAEVWANHSAWRTPDPAANVARYESAVASHPSGVALTESQQAEVANLNYWRGKAPTPTEAPATPIAAAAAPTIVAPAATPAMQPA